MLICTQQKGGSLHTTLAATMQKAQDNTTYCEQQISQHSQRGCQLENHHSMRYQLQELLAFMYEHCYLAAPQTTSIKACEEQRH